jgi:hypothetical protein
LAPVEEFSLLLLLLGERPKRALLEVELGVTRSLDGEGL